MHVFISGPRAPSLFIFFWILCNKDITSLNKYNLLFGTFLSLLKIPTFFLKKILLFGKVDAPHTRPLRGYHNGAGEHNADASEDLALWV